MRKVLILVVDTDPRFAEFVTQTVTPFGWEVERASNGLDALKAVETRPRAFSAVLSAIKLPVMDGPELLQRFQDKGLTIPIILFCDSTHLGLPPTVGAITMPKSITPRELTRLLDGFLRRK